MTWLQRYRVRQYMRDSIWFGPFLGAIGGIALARVLDWTENALHLESDTSPETALAVLGAMAGAMFTFIVFVSSALLIAVQLASATLSPRIIAIVFRDRVTRMALSIFVFTFTFTLAVMIRIGDLFHQLTLSVAAVCCFLSLAVFLVLIDHVGKALRPSGTLRSVVRLGRQVIENVYPRKYADPVERQHKAGDVLKTSPTRTIHSPWSGVVLAFDIPGLVSLAENGNCVIELAPQVGDLISESEPLFHVYEGGDTLSGDALCQTVAVGQERTFEQDPAFAFRIIVDIAAKGLSPAINDPTTAVLAIDQLQYLLGEVGRRSLDDERVRDKTGRLRLAYRTPDWPDYVSLAVTEIRQFGGTSIQIARRLRAMLESLVQVLPEMRKTLLRRELDLLHRSAERFFPEPEDRALAGMGDSQGMGGKGGFWREKTNVGQ